MVLENTGRSRASQCLDPKALMKKQRTESYETQTTTEKYNS